MLVAIDGTGSRKWFNGHNSHVFSFYADYASGERAYLPGPDDRITGLDVGGLVDKAWGLVSGKLLQGVEPIDLVGHSRGGLAVILLAQRLQGWKTGPVPVRFLGLYDAVDRTPTRWRGFIPANVQAVYHVLRDPRAHSRNGPVFGFGNTGTSYAAGVRYHRRYIFGTHSAMGGDPWHGDHPRQLDEWHDKVAAHQAKRFIRDGALAERVKFSS